MMTSAFLLLVAAIFSSASGGAISVDNPDMSEIYRPCCFTDVQCIREEFFKRNWFVDASTLPSDPFKSDLIIPEITIEESYFNLTIVMSDSRFGKLADAEVVEFYINNVTDRAVLALSFSNFTVDSKGLFIYHRVAQEPVVINTHITAFYPTMLATTVITGLSPCDKHTYTTNGRIISELPKYDLGCGLEEIKDPEVRCLFKTFSERITIAVQGSSKSLAPIFSTFYMAALTKPRGTCKNIIFDAGVPNCC